MARIRSVKPEFWSDPVMAKLSHSARLLYIGLWGYCDDEGRGQFIPKQIEGFVFPREDLTTQSGGIHELLTELREAGRIVVYEAEGEEFFHIPKWHEHQKPQHPRPSKFPAPDQGECIPPEDLMNDSGEAHEVLTPVVVEGEGEGVREPKGSRPPDPEETDRIGVWTALEDLFGEPAETDRKLRGKVLRSLLKAGATHSEVHRRAEAWPKLFPASNGGKPPTLTVTALEKHWGQLGKLLEDIPEPFDPDDCVHPDDRVSFVEDTPYCGMCSRELETA